MKATQQRYFYWMQHDEPENDPELCKKVHNVLNNISDVTVPQKTAPTPGAPAAAAGAAGGQNQQMDAFFQNLMSMQAAGAPMKPEDMSPSLPTILTQEKLLELIKDDPEVQKTLIPHLPEGQ